MSMDYKEDENMNGKEKLAYLEKKYKVDIKTAEDFYALLKKYGHYKLYFNQKQGEEYTLKNMTGNCADWNNDVVRPVLEALGYDVVTGHVTVTCNDGKQYGHWLLFISGRRWKNKVFDVVAATKTGRAFGTPCCIHKPMVIIKKAKDLKIS